ncbi:iron complex transport system substrate-binding protein [Pullulanibacillus pueri]|uniref:ABC transporter substrate-binding protein n=1 Tax=Pullulanibacillus pueri TaxID=1437324 RepID=A0A8J3EKP5_9BACL|nr:iron-hydroxamate ABC transporter substrate-binding protein [Pullulanibacillus pueri]MBM7681221.1 iron complex transport system substrate-binding protein [Pullulanibacillus pueri]GGH77983.1 ABC transporter substrate-binding protein [Pullulanibacillus pueri]
MSKKFLPLLLLLILVLSACSSRSSEDSKSSNVENKDKMVTYQSENGPVKVPAHPKRVVILDLSAGEVMKLGVPIVGVDTYAKNNPNYQPYLKGVEVVSADDLEKIAALKPDLIIGYSSTKNLDRLKKIAPTVTYTYGKLDYLQLFEEIGKLVNKEKEAKDWVASYHEKAQALSKKIKAKIGEDATVSVVETSAKQFYVFGDNWGRGTEILYQEMHLNMPQMVKDKALKPGYYQISQEVLPKYFGDYVILSVESGADTSFEKTDTYKNIPAVKNHHVYKVNTSAFSFNDPISLDYQLKVFQKDFLGE